MLGLTGHKSLAFVFLAALAVLALPSPSSAQVLYGALVGNVTDPSDAAVPGASVTIVHKETGLSRQTTTNEVGFYNFPTIDSGTYDIKVTKEGFRVFTRQSQDIRSNFVTRVDVVLAVGSMAEAVTVEAEAPVLQSDRAEIRVELGGNTLQRLPAPPGRNYQKLYITLPGFTPPADAHSIPSNPSRSQVFNVNGTSRSSNNTRVDGASQWNIWLPHVTAYVPALEAIEEVNVVTNSFDAEQGLAGGAAINVQIRSGTNQMHGSLFEYHNDVALRARHVFFPKKDPQVFNQFGGTVGGPIKRNKLFYFGSYEDTRDHRGFTRNESVPDMPMRLGNLSRFSTKIYDPATGNPDGSGRKQFEGNIIPPERIDRVAKLLLERMPPPTRSVTDLVSNFTGSGPQSLDRKTVDSKLNWTANDKLTMFARYSLLDYTSFTSRLFGTALAGQPFPPGTQNPGHAFGQTNSGTLGANYIFAPRFVVDAHFGYTRMDTSVEQDDITQNIGLDVLKIPGTNGTNRIQGGFPRFDIGPGNFAVLGETENYMPYFRSDDQYVYNASASWTKGTHNIRFGFDLSRQGLNHTQPEIDGSLGARGGFEFGGGPTALRGGDSPDKFNAFATFLLGLPTRAGKNLETALPYTTRAWQHSYYVRDQWQTTRKLTLNYGIRWEYFPMPTRADRGLELYNPVTNKMLIGGVGSVPTDLGIEQSKKLFAPRIGIAYRATNTLVVRAGYGISIDPYSLSRPFRTNHPILIDLNVVAPNAFAWASRLQDGIPPHVVPSLGDGIIDVPGTVTAVTTDPQFQRGYVQSWNFTLQKDIGKGFVAQAAYVGTRQVRQLGVRQLNYGPIGGGNAGRILATKFGRTGAVQYIAPVGTGQYNALQTQLTHRFASGYQVNASYTYSKAIGITPDSDNTPRVNLPEFYGLNRALTDYDRTHNLQIVNIVELPFGRGKRWLSSGVASAIAGGWQLNSILSRYSGLPFSVGAAGATLDAPNSDQRADLVKPEVKISGGTGPGQFYFDPDAFASPPTARGLQRFGNFGYNRLRGPGVTNLSLGVFRNIRLSERWTLQFRGESFNFTNTPHFDFPSSSNRSVANKGRGFGQITTAIQDERQFRLGLRLSF